MCEGNETYGVSKCMGCECGNVDSICKAILGVAGRSSDAQHLCLSIMNRGLTQFHQALYVVKRSFGLGVRPQTTP